MRTTDAKIRQLREVIQKLKNGEELDVRKALGTGNRASEDEWEEVLREIEAEEMSWKAKVEAMQQKRNTQKNSDDISNNNPPAENQSTSPRPPRFY
ncbi:hypothetical protein FQN57_003041 [Myotisia sp. PD_48]|nr:hypothetical protein FQN57_003041 [Myotisia sp. PD_48]